MKQIFTVKKANRIITMIALVALAIGTVYIGVQLKKLNDVIEGIRSEIPMSALTN